MAKICLIYYSNSPKLLLQHILINILYRILKSTENNRYGIYLNYKVKLLIIFYLLPTPANEVSTSISIMYMVHNIFC